MNESKVLGHNALICMDKCTVNVHNVHNVQCMYIVYTQCTMHVYTCTCTYIVHTMYMYTACMLTL